MSEAPLPVSGRMLRRNLGWVAASYAIAGAVGFAATAVIARRIGRSEFGTYAAALSLVAIVRVVDRIARDEVVVRDGARRPRDVGDLVGTFLGLKLVTAIIGVAIGTAAAFAFGFGSSGIQIVALGALMAGADGATDAFRSGLQAIERLDRAVAISIGVSVSSAAGMIAVIQSGGGIVGAVAASTACSVAAVPIAWLVSHKCFHVRITFRRSRLFLRNSLPFALIGTLTVGLVSVDVLLVLLLLGRAQAGLYGAAGRLLVIIGWMPIVVQTAAYRSLASLDHRSAAFAKLVRNLSAFLLIIAAAIAAGGYITSGRILALAFGRDFAAAAPAFRILLLSLVFSFPGIPLLTALMVRPKPNQAARVLLLGFVTDVAIDLVFIPRFGIVAASWGAVVSSLVVTAGFAFVLSRDGVKLHWVRTALPLVPASLACMIAVRSTASLALPIVIAIGALAYSVSLIALRVPWSFREAHVIEPEQAGSPKVSIVMPVYNVAPFVKETVTSLLRQTLSDFELVIVNDGSTDNTLGIVRQIDDPRIQIIDAPHAGVVASINLGISRARGTYIARVDGDDLCMSECLERQAEMLDRNPATAAVAVWSRRFGARQFAQRPPVSPRAIKRKLRRTWVLCLPIMYRRSMLKAVGEFRGIRGSSSENWDMSIRLASLFELRVIPEDLALIRNRAGSATARATRKQYRLDKMRMQLRAAVLLGPDLASIAAFIRSMLRLPFDLLHSEQTQVISHAAQSQLPRISVVVPTYGRVEQLKGCLDAVERQCGPDDEIVVAYRPTDAPTAQWLSIWERERRRKASVDIPGIVPALRAGTTASSGNVVAFIDDDAIPRKGWLDELRRAFLDPTVGAAGGPIADHAGDTLLAKRARRVGRVTWYGRIIYAHRDQQSYYGDVDWLTGSNMAIRSNLCVHDSRLHHSANGLALGNDLDVTLMVKRAGMRVLYSPGAIVDHYTTSYRDPILGSRTDGDDVVAAAANLTYITLKFLPRSMHPIALAYGYLFGSASVPGPLRVLVELPLDQKRAAAMAHRVRATWRGRKLGTQMWHEHQGTNSKPVTILEREPVA
ncbi:MAG: glycosyltransferase [Actinomycetota bacterium]